MTQFSLVHTRLRETFGRTFTRLLSYRHATLPGIAVVYKIVFRLVTLEISVLFIFTRRGVTEII